MSPDVVGGRSDGIKVSGLSYGATDSWPENLFVDEIRLFLINSKRFLPCDVMQTAKFAHNCYDPWALEIKIDGRMLTMGVTNYDSKTKTRGPAHVHAFVQGSPDLVPKGLKLVYEARDHIMAERRLGGAADPWIGGRSSSSHEVYVGG